MNNRIASAILSLAIFVSPFSVIAQELPIETREAATEVTVIAEESLVGEILATSTIFVAEAVEGEVVLASEPVDSIDPDTYIAGELIVVFEDSVTEQETEALAETFNLDSIESLGGDDTVTLVATDGMIEQVIAELEASPDIVYVEPNYIREVEAFTAYSIDTIDATEAWLVATGTDVVIAVIDTGVDYTHPDFSGRMWDGSACVSDLGAFQGNCVGGYDFATNDTDPIPQNGSTSWQHGTHVAGIAAGIAPGAKIMALRFGLSVSTEIKAINFARENGARIINASYSGESFSQAEHDAIEAFTDGGGLFIAVAGNDAEDLDVTPEYPASYDLPGIIAVSATNAFDELAIFSSFGENTVDLAAPGTAIRSTYPNNQYATASGTSMAAPHVAATAALLKQRFPALDAAGIKERVLRTGDAAAALQGTSMSGKRVNAHRALTLDYINPVITVLGSASITLNTGDSFTDPGATALDDFDGDITSRIATSSTVNTAIAGTYEVTYAVSDAAGNSATSTRSVTIQVPQTSGGGGGGGGGGGSSKKNKDKKKKIEKKRTAPTKAKVTPKEQIADPARLPQSTSTVLGSATTTPAASAYIFTLSLSIGVAGIEVTKLQERLVSSGFLLAAPTGYFGTLTQSAVMAYQRSKGIPPLGIVGPATRAALNGR